MSLQPKLTMLLQAQEALLKSALLPEAVRKDMYSLSQQIGEGNKLISELMKEIKEADPSRVQDDDDTF